MHADMPKTTNHHIDSTDLDQTNDALIQNYIFETP